ncbi:alpha/beta hydrolase family protein [Marinomonas aquiplantarum]|nr:alpha/beta fold hydrolase [Marinomonas aquiplantarum]
MMKIYVSLVFWLLSCCGYAVASSVGFDQTILYGESDRPLKVSVWYPSKDVFPTEKVAENLAFFGTKVVRIGTPLSGQYPLVVISHGYRGNWRNQNWLATKLAHDGYVVAALDHPGTTSFDHSPMAAAKWWKRPKDISRLLDWLLDDSNLTPYIDPTNITAIGHSLGGWTVMNLAGSEVDNEQLSADCLPTPNSRVCSLTAELGMLNDKPLGVSSLRDERIRRVVSLDLGLARSFSKQSLQTLTVPTLILAAGVDIGDLPQAQESGFLAKYIAKNKRRYIVYPDAAHFSFMQVCKPGAIEILEEEVPGDGIICKDGGQRSRAALHQDMLQKILAFIRST